MRRVVSVHERWPGERGASALELALLLPILVVLIFGIIDLGRLIHARLVVANVSREGGSLASRDIQTGNNLIAMLQSSATPFDLAGQGKIFVIKIKAGTSQGAPFPYIYSWDESLGGYPASSSVGGTLGQTPTGFLRTSSLWNHLVYQPAPQGTADIAEISIVEVFYHYRPITPLPNFIQNMFPTNGGILIGSRAVF